MPRLDPDESRRRFAASDHAHLATADSDGQPHLVPVVFAVISTDGVDEIVHAVDAKPKTTARLRRLATIAENPRVCFLVDRYDDDWDALWWVRADAEARVVEAGPDHTRTVAALRDRYPQYAGHVLDGPAVIARVTRWSGWAAQGS